jgi:hypothetical protein
MKAPFKSVVLSLSRISSEGIGSALLRAVESAFPSTKQFELFTGSRSEGNIRLYERHCYIVTHRRDLSPNVTLVFMSKSNAATD